MDTLTMVAVLIGQLAMIAKDPALGYRGQALTETLALLATILTNKDVVQAELDVLAAQVQAMVDANREPTKEEWGALRDLSRRHHEILNPPPVA
jgi:hypothetical protein